MPTKKIPDKLEKKTTGIPMKTSQRASKMDAKKTPAPAATETRSQGEKLEFDLPIVGIGASAGGLEAFEQFFTNMPSDSGMAFVLVQHLDPTHPSILGELVRRYTRMDVMDIEDGMEIKPDAAFIIPPNCDMGIINGKFQLMVPVAPRGLRLPIDFFFRSLPEDQKERAICIILSGTGTDGTLGLKEIKGAGGMAMVQDPTSAKYDGMPGSAIGSGLVDYVLPPGKMPAELPIRIFGTDIDSDAIETARAGIYPDSIAVDVPAEYLERFFTREENSFHVTKVVRDWIVFSSQNVASDPPFSRIDLISCRNLLIYMGADLQKRVLPLFHYSLNEDGFLFLGTSETIDEFTHLFGTVDRKWKVYRKKKGSASQIPRVELPIPAPAELGIEYPLPVDQTSAKKTSFRQLTERMLLTAYGPTAVLVNEKCEMLYVHGKTGPYLEHHSGEATLNILEQAREGLKLELTTAIRKAITRKSDVRYEHLHLQANGQERIINLLVKPIEDPPYMRGLVLVVFEGVTAEMKQSAEQATTESDNRDHSSEVRRLRQELSSTKEYLRTTIEELETSNEELKSTNEELQSVNEELTTVNTELQNKIDALTRVNNDMNNLIASTEIGTIFLDLEMNIQRFTPSIKPVVNLRPSDLGRPLSDFSTSIANANLLECVKEVLDSLTLKESEVQVGNGNWYLMRVRPYRTTDRAIEGVVVTFVEITAQKETHHELIKLQQAVEQSPSVVMITDTEGKIEYVNPKFSEITGFARYEAIGKHPSILQSGDHPQSFYKQLWETIRSGKEWSGEFHNRKKSGDLYWESARISPVRCDRGMITHFVAVKEDITDRKKTEATFKKAQQDLEHQVAQRTAELEGANACLEREIAERKVTETTLRKSNELLENAFSITRVRIACLDNQFNFVRVNPAYAQANGKHPDSFVGKPYFDLFPDDSETRAAFERVLETGEFWNFFAKVPDFRMIPWEKHDSVTGLSNRSRSMRERCPVSW